MQEKVLIAIYHKDRINYLENLLNSLEKNIKFKKIKYKIIIFDNSSHSKNIKYLQSIKKYKVYFSKMKSGTLGNLYSSMNETIKICIQDRYNFFFTLQDDMQIVRKIYDSDFYNLKELFKNNSKVLCCKLSFFRKINCLDFKYIFLNYKKNFYVNVKSSYSDVAFFSTKVLKQLKFNFKLGEDYNDKHYSKLGYRSIHILYPIIHYLPWGESARISRIDKIFILRVIKKLFVIMNKIGTNSKLHKLKLKQKNLFFNRNINIFPTDELFLETDDKLILPWAYDPIWSLSKFKNFKNLFLFDWIFNGSKDYIDLKRRILDKKLINKKFFYAKNKYFKL